VIVLQEIYGVNREMRRVADLLATAGYVALVPNFYYRTDPELAAPYTPEGAQIGMKAAAGITRATLRADLGAAIDWLNGQEFVAFGHLATWGFCLGGTVAFFSATMPGISAAAAFYGTGIARPLHSGEPEMLAEVADLRAPLLLVFGGQDQGIPPDAIARIEQALSAAGKRFEVQVYPAVGHAFFRGSEPDHHVAESSDAWERVQAFFRKHLT
jgi:carboxymethylenebutenolidase